MLQVYKPPKSIVTNILSKILKNNNKLLTLKLFQKIHSETPSFSKPSLWASKIYSSLQANNYKDFIFFYNAITSSGDFDPIVSIFVSVFRKASNFRDGLLGILFHCVVVKLGFGYDVVLQTRLVNFYAKIGDLQCARKVFGEMSQRDVVACNVMIVGFGKHGFVKDARRLFDEMVEKDSYSWNSMVSCYFKIGDVDNARRIFDRIPLKNEVSWNVLMDGYVKSGYFSNADHLGDLVSLYNEMRFSNVCPTETVLSLIIRRCASFCSTRLGKAFHCQIFKRNFCYDVVLQTGVLDFYAKIGDLTSAKRVFSEMSHRDIVANNAMISALSKYGFVKDAQNLFDSMHEKDSVTWNSLITCYSKIGDVDSARLLFDSNPIKNVVSWNAMIDGYCKACRLSYAEELFNKIGGMKNHVTWNTMIAGFVQCQEYRRALHLFDNMQAERVKPTEITMVSLLSACAHLGALDMGEWIHDYINKNKLKIDVVLGNTLIDMYCKCGSISPALDVFHKLQVKNIYCWNSVIVGLAMHGYGKEAIDYFLKMIQEDINPDGVTFISLLCACSHSGLVSQGKMYFSQMKTIYDVEPGIEHFGCMVDLLGRSGQLKEALELINNMPMKPNVVVWGSLLRSCHIHKNTEIGERVTQRLLDLDPCDGGNYVFLSNLYASLRRWKDVDTCRKLMTESGVHKAPGYSSIEVDYVVHQFVAGDSSHLQFAQINAFLVEIGKKLKDEGYEADTESVLHDIDDEDKEGSVSHHSERIAVAFGLMNIPFAKEIRVFKNLRTCDDCHTVMKLISKIYKREIIMRDRNRFHHFKNGVCSCKDYW
uniref:pentatricopeptide repeat-containing protein At3g62890-like n=1 Tax=Erigeron canadensis TaxID=72917 RepID=UPI001CB980C7|nr:pentatricopeptide repeat-containing protein At3g62890-like [Erigeron canadensis]